MIEQNSDIKYDYQYKIAMIGDSCVGKSSVAYRFTENKFSESLMNTLGVDYTSKWIKLEGKNINIQIWDTAGQERFKHITRNYYRNAQGIVIVYDITDQKSFESVKEWLQRIEENCDVNIGKILVGNKCDLNSKREVSLNDGKCLADSYLMPFIETSAKNSTNVQELFERIAIEIKKNSLKLPINTNNLNRIQKQTNKSKCDC